MKKNEKKLSHEKWVECQFNKYNKSCFRDVVLHTSFIESTIIAESERFHPFPCLKERGQFRTFGYAIELLKTNDDYKDKDFEAINDLREKRNNLIHGIMEEGIDQNEIESRVGKIYEKIKEVYKSDLFNKIFEKFANFKKRNYGFLPKDKLSKFK